MHRPLTTSDSSGKWQPISSFAHSSQSAEFITLTVLWQNEYEERNRKQAGELLHAREMITLISTHFTSSDRSIQCSNYYCSVPSENPKANEMIID